MRQSPPTIRLQRRRHYWLYPFYRPERANPIFRGYKLVFCGCFLLMRGGLWRHRYVNIILHLLCHLLLFTRGIFSAHGGAMQRWKFYFVFYTYSFLNFGVYAEYTNSFVFSQTKVMGNVLHVYLSHLSHGLVYV